MTGNPLPSFATDNDLLVETFYHADGVVLRISKQVPAPMFDDEYETVAELRMAPLRAATLAATLSRALQGYIECTGMDGVDEDFAFDLREP